MKKTIKSQLYAQSPKVKAKPVNELAANEPVKPEKPKVSEAKIDTKIKALRGDFAGITGFIADEFVKIAKANNGIIDIENPTFAKSAVSTILSGEKEVQNMVKGATNRLISETLGKKDKNFYVLDESKLTPGNLEKLSKLVENAITQGPLMSGVIKSIERESGLKINDARKVKLLKNISPALGQLDPEYLEQYKDVIATDLAKEIQAQGSTWGRINGELRTSTKSQQMIANNLLKKHLASSEKFITNKISGTFYKKQLTNTQMSDRLNEFAKARGSEQIFKASKIPSDKDLAQMRKANPKLFDNIVLGDKAKPKIPDNVRKKLAGSMKVDNSKRAAVQPSARGKANQSAERGM